MPKRPTVGRLHLEAFYWRTVPTVTAALCVTVTVNDCGPPLVCLLDERLVTCVTGMAVIRRRIPVVHTCSAFVRSISVATPTSLLRAVGRDREQLDDFDDGRGDG